MSEEKKTTARKAAPEGISAGLPNLNERKSILERLDKDNPDYVHSYQSPSIMAGTPEAEWTLESKGQEVVKRADGKLVHHKGDPVVRQRRDQFDAARKQEGEFSRQQVETVVKPQRSTVRRRPKEVEQTE